MNKLKLVVWLPFLIIGSISSASCPDPKGVINNLLVKWRSQDRHIDGGALREESELFIPASLRKSLARCEQEQIIAAFHDPELRGAWALTEADAENILKIRKITQLTLSGQRPFANVDGRVHGYQNEIVGLSQARLDAVLAKLNLPIKILPLANKPVGRSEHQFNYVAHKLKGMVFKSGNSTLIDNDLYAFTVAAVFYNLGWHDSKSAVFENSTRGADQYPFMIAAGQDQVLDLLENGRFTRWDIEVVRNYLEPRMKVKPGFYEWLANWRFRGTVRSMSVGTVVFPKEPVLQVIADPASAIIVESLINPWMSYMTNMTTTAVRNMIAAGAIKVVTEAGTRRLVTGNLSALTALMAGATGTSNVLMAALTGATPYGTMSHASIGMFPTEIEAVEEFTKTMRNPTLLLPDTYDFLTGMRTAIRGGGDKVATVRQDSNIVRADGSSLSTADTIKEIRKLWSALGREQWGGVVTNDLTEKTLRDLAQSGLDIEVASVGGAFASSSVGVAHGNFVYKLVEVRDLVANSVRYPIKIANGEKSTEPAEKDLYRIQDVTSGLYQHDLKVSAGSNYSAPTGQVAVDLSPVVMRNGHRLGERVKPKDVAGFIHKQLSHFAPQLLEGTATRKSLGAENYSVSSSGELVQTRQNAIVAVTPQKARAYFGGSREFFSAGGKWKY